MKLTFLLALLSVPALAAPVATLRSDFDGDSLPDSAALFRQSGAPGSGYLRLEIRLGSGKRIESRRLVRSLRKATLSASPFGLLISSVEDQSSHSQAFDYTVAFEGGEAELSIFNFEFSYPSRDGSCHVTPGSGLALVNGEAVSIPARKHRLPATGGVELEKICHELLLRR